MMIHLHFHRTEPKKCRSGILYSTESELISSTMRDGSKILSIFVKQLIDKPIVRIHYKLKVQFHQ